MINQPIVNTQLVTLSGNTRAEAIAANDRGAVPDAFPMRQMMLQLKRPPAQEQAIETLIEQQQDPASPNFHHWLTPEEIGTQYGPATADVNKITSWLRSQGFQVGQVYPNNMVVDFSGNAGQVRTAFHTSIHNLSVNGEAHFANMADPQIPAALAPAVAGIVSLNDFQPHKQVVPLSEYTLGGGGFYVVPADLATIYNLNPLFSAGLTGQGQTITLVEDTNLFSNNDWSTFVSTFGLSGYGGTLTTINPAPPSGSNNCPSPGVTADDDEAILDTEWATAAAPSAAIVVAACPSSGPTFGFFIAIQNLINQANPPTIVSMSYGVCEAQLGAAANAAINSAYQQGVAEGMSIYVSAGDQLGTGCDRGANGAIHGHNVNGFASTQYNVAVGGTDFDDLFTGTSSTYWNASNSATFGSAKSYIPELPWNNTCASEQLAKFVSGSTVTYGVAGFCNNAGSGYVTIAGGSGGPSNCASGAPVTAGVGGTGSCAGYPKPSYQTGLFGMPNDGVRDLPDVSLFSASGLLGHAFVYCLSDPNNGGKGCNGAPSGWNSAGGTSFASPILAGFQALVNQHVGGKQGNPNANFYALAKSEYGGSGNAGCNSSNGNGVNSACVFYDVTVGDIDAPCLADGGTFWSCYRPSGTYGVLSASNSAFQPEYLATSGWDYATGIGTVNAFNLIKGWSANVAPNSTLSVSETGTGTVTSSPSGINCGTACSASYFTGIPVSLTASPGSGYSFAGWSGACSGTGGCTVTMNGAESVSASFTPIIFSLSVSTAGSGTITSSPAGINCGSTCSANYAIGTQVTLTAAPASGWNFNGWGGACSGTAPCTVTMSAAQTVSATFTQSLFALSVSVSGNGAVTSSDGSINCGANCSANYASGMQVFLAPSPASGWSFAGWGGACGGIGTCIISMSQAQSVAAAFSQGASPSSPLVAAVLPASRSATVNNTVTAFATIINAGSTTAPACAITPEGGLPLSFVFQTTNPTTNALTGTANTPVDIPAGQPQSFVIGLTPTSAFPPVQLPFSFACQNVPQAPIVTGLNTLLLSSSTTPVADIVALAASGDPGIVDIPGATGTGAFAVATVDVGAASNIAASANTGGASLPVTLTICETDPGSGNCLAAPAASVATAINPGQTPTFAVFVQGSGVVPFDPANNRVSVQFADSTGTIRGETSVAVRTQ